MEEKRELRSLRRPTPAIEVVNETNFKLGREVSAALTTLPQSMYTAASKATETGIHSKFN